MSTRLQDINRVNCRASGITDNIKTKTWVKLEMPKGAMAVGQQKWSASISDLKLALAVA